MEYRVNTGYGCNSLQLLDVVFHSSQKGQCQIFARDNLECCVNGVVERSSSLTTMELTHAVGSFTFLIIP